MMRTTGEMHVCAHMIYTVVITIMQIEESGEAKRSKRPRPDPLELLWKDSTTRKKMDKGSTHHAAVVRRGADALSSALDRLDRCRPDMRKDIIDRFLKKEGVGPSMEEVGEISVCKRMVGVMKKNVDALVDQSWLHANDTAKRCLNLTCQLVVEKEDRVDRMTSKKARALGLRRATLASFVDRADEPLELRCERATRSDALNCDRLVSNLWHDVCEEMKGKMKRCSMHVTINGTKEKHRRHFQHGTVEDCFKRALETKRCIDWRRERIDRGLPSKLTLRRFRNVKCRCVRKPGHKFAVCWRHNGLA